MESPGDIAQARSSWGHGSSKAPMEEEDDDDVRIMEQPLSKGKGKGKGNMQPMEVVDLVSSDEEEDVHGKPKTAWSLLEQKVAQAAAGAKRGAAEGGAVALGSSSKRQKAALAPAIPAAPPSLPVQNLPHLIDTGICTNYQNDQQRFRDFFRQYPIEPLPPRPPSQHQHQSSSQKQFLKNQQARWLDSFGFPPVTPTPEASGGIYAESVGGKSGLKARSTKSRVGRLAGWVRVVLRVDQVCVCVCVCV